MAATKEHKAITVCKEAKVKTNVPPVGATRSRCGSSVKSFAYTPCSVTPRQQVAEFPGEFLDVSGGELFCTACREEISLKCQVIRLHVHSKKHMTGKECLQVKKLRDVDIAKCFNNTAAGRMQSE